VSGEDVGSCVELKYEEVRTAFQNTRLNHLIHLEILIIISMFHRAFFSSIIDKHQHMHFFTFKTVLV